MLPGAEGDGETTLSTAVAGYPVNRLLLLQLQQLQLLLYASQLAADAGKTHFPAALGELTPSSHAASPNFRALLGFVGNLFYRKNPQQLQVQIALAAASARGRLLGIDTSSCCPTVKPALLLTDYSKFLRCAKRKRRMPTLIRTGQ